MSIYGQRTRAGNPRNPAKALYSYWYSVLKPIWKLDVDGRPTGCYQFGHDRSYGIGPVEKTYGQGLESEIGTNDYPHLAFGGAWRTWASVNNDFILTRKGEFRLTRFHGEESRNRVARNTFLDWQRHASRYQWFINTSGELVYKYGNLLQAWRNPVHYVEESLVAPGYGVQPIWLKLVWDTNFVGNWRIDFSRMSETSSRYYQTGPTEKDFEQYAALRERRYRLIREEELLSVGELEKRGRRLVSTQETKARQAAQALALAAHLTVSTPARTFPLKRTSEEEVTHGNDLGTHDPNGAQAVAPVQR